MDGSIRVFFRFLSNEPEAPAFWTTLTFWILNISLAVTAWADYHVVFLRLEGLFAHFFASFLPQSRDVYSKPKCQLMLFKICF